MERYVNDFIKYSIMNCDGTYSGDYKKANYANDKLRKIEKALVELGEAEKFIDEIISTVEDQRVLGWICSYAIEINYNLPRMEKILKNIIRTSKTLDAFEAEIMLEIIAKKKKKEN